MLKRFPRSVAIRFSMLIMMLSVVYFGVFFALRDYSPLQGRDLLVAFGAYTAALFVVIAMTTHKWLSWLVMPLHEVPHEFETAKKIVDGFAAKVGFPVDIRVIQSKRVFIYSTGISKRMVIISDKALRALSTPALRGVLAHEIAHMVLNHAPKNATLLAAFFGLRIAVSMPSLVNMYFLLMLLMLLRNNEYEADRVGALMTGKEDLRAALDEVQSLTKMRNFGRLFEFMLSTHPSYERRRQRLSAEITAGD